MGRMTVKNRWLILVISAALVLCLAGALLRLTRQFIRRPQFDADDARERIVFKVDLGAADVKDAVLESVRETVERRLEQSELLSGFLVQIAGGDRIDVLTPEITEQQVQQIRELVTRPGTLEFALLANQYEHRALIEAARTSTESQSRDEGWAWVPVAADVEDIGRHGGIVVRSTATTDTSQAEYLVVRGTEENRVSGVDVVRAYEALDPAGNPAVNLYLSNQGGTLMWELTTAASPKPNAEFKSRLAIILDGKIHSAPQVNGPVRNSLQIAGPFNQQEAWELGVVLSAGELPAPVEFVESEVVGEGAE
jgi:preprotein translocase subunit SecD